MTKDERALDHAWQYFQLHANQRMTIYNYFVVFSGLLVTGLGAAVQNPPSSAFIGIVLGSMLGFLAFVFFKLDQRVSFLIKNAELTIGKFEPEGASLFLNEVDLTLTAKKRGLWTYGRAFRTVFVVMGLVGVAGAVYSAIEWSDSISLTATNPSIEQYEETQLQEER